MQASSRELKITASHAAVEKKSGSNKHADSPADDVCSPSTEVSPALFAARRLLADAHTAFNNRRTNNSYSDECTPDERSSHFFQGTLGHSTSLLATFATTQCRTPTSAELHDNMFLSKSIIKTLNTDANPEKYNLWSSSFLTFMQKLRSSASDVLTFSDAQWLTCLNDNEYGQSWLELDSIMSTTLFACFDTASSSKYVEVIAQRLKRTNGLQSGRAIWQALSEAANPTSGPRRQERESIVKSKSYFTNTTTPVECELAMEHMLTDWSSTTEGKTGEPLAFIKYACSKLPGRINLMSIMAGISQMPTTHTCTSHPW